MAPTSLPCVSIYRKKTLIASLPSRVSEFRKKRYFPVADSTPRLLARPKPRLAPELIHFIHGNSTASCSDPSVDALSTTITS